MHLIQSYTPYRTQQRPIVTSVNMAEYIHVGAELQWMPFFYTCCEILLISALFFSFSPTVVLAS